MVQGPCFHAPVPRQHPAVRLALPHLVDTFIPCCGAYPGLMDSGLPWGVGSGATGSGGGRSPPVIGSVILGKSPRAAAWGSLLQRLPEMDLGAFIPTQRHDSWRECNVLRRATCPVGATARLGWARLVRCLWGLTLGPLGWSGSLKGAWAG